MSKKKTFQKEVTGKFPITPESIVAMRNELVAQGADPNSVLTVGQTWVRRHRSDYGHYAITFEMIAPETPAQRQARLDKATAKINALAREAGLTVEVS